MNQAAKSMAPDLNADYKGVDLLGDAIKQVGRCLYRWADVYNVVLYIQK